MTSPVLLIVIPLLMAFITLLIKSYKSEVLLLTAFANVVILATLTKGITAIGGFDAPFGISLVLDHYALVGLILINVLFFFTVISHKSQIDPYQTVLLTLLAGLNGMLLTGDLFNLFVFMEITAISLYVMTTQSKKLETTFHYLILGTVGSSLYLLGVILLYSRFGSLNMMHLASLQTAGSLSLLLPLLLVFIGLSVEAKMMPFNSWVKGIYQNANALVGSLMASVVATVVLLVMGRILMTFYEQGSLIANTVLAIAIITLLAGELSAYKSTTIKDLLLNSSIGQSGLMVLLLLSGMTFPALLLLINNAVAKWTMFSIADVLAPNNEAIANIKGRFHAHRLLGLAFTISSLSLIGLPLFLGFYGKLNALMGLMALNMTLPLVVLFVTLIEGAYIMRLLMVMWHAGSEGETITEMPKASTTTGRGPLTAVVLLLSLSLVLSGVLPSFLGEWLTDDTLPGDQNTSYLIHIKGGR